MDKEKYQVLRVWKQTHHNLRLIAALTNESMVEALDRIVSAELHRIQAQEKNEHEVERQGR